MRLLSHALDGLYLFGLVFLAAIVACGGIDVHLGPLALRSQKVIVPGMAVWLLAILSGLARRGGAGDSKVEQVGITPSLWGAWLVAALMVLGACWPGLGRPLFTDDLAMVESASRLDASMVCELFRGHGWSTSGFIRPLPELLWAIEYRVHACDPLACHLLNLALHLLNVFLVGCLARRVIGDPVGAPAAMLLFAVCGTHAEPLLWLSSRYDLLATTFGLVALLEYERRPALGLAATALALFSKEAALGLPLALAYLELVHGARRRWAVAAPLGLLALYMVWRCAMLGGVTNSATGSWVGYDKLVELPLAMLAPLGWPANIEQVGDLPLIVRVAVGCGLAVGPLLVTASLSRGQDRPLAIAAALMLFCALPVHNVISLSATLKQSRYLYLPAAGFALAMGACARGLGPRRAAVALGVLVACHAVLLGSNVEPYAEAGRTVTDLLESAGPVRAALRTGAVVQLCGLPRFQRGAPVAVGFTVIAPVCAAARVPLDRLYIEGDDWRAPPAHVDRRFDWSPESGFSERAAAP